MIKVFTVCPQGLGSSMIAKINVQKVLDSLGIDSDIECSGVASIIGQKYDLIVTIEEMRNSLEWADQNKIVYISNFFKKDEIAQKVEAKLKELKIIN
ncbi:MAG: PTS sugar transporter subunit IIB [Anaerolineaceae bacterium]